MEAEPLPTRLAPLRARARVCLRDGSTLRLFVAAVSLSALLLFSVQPMFTKIVLPVLGGTPAVWSVALVFFQTMLLAGYCYAHLLTRWASHRVAVIIHLGVFASALVALPIELPAGWTTPPVAGEAFWLIGLFSVSVGLPFFAVAANGPLLQSWFARSAHPRAADPYFLYVASNVGSFGALAAYPLVIEPFLPLALQSRVWAIGLACLAGLIATCGVVARQHGPARLVAARTIPNDEAAPRWGLRASWVGLAFVPSGLLVSVTAHISTDVAAAPLLWAVPLSLFLLTFVVAFRDKPLLSTDTLARLQVWGTGLVLIDVRPPSFLVYGLLLHLGLFVTNSIVCHGALYRIRPAPARLTEFYVCMSLGGVLGGVVCGLIAPHVFSRVLEYPLLLVAALFCRPGFLGGITRRAGALGILVAIAVTSLAYPVAVALLPEYGTLLGRVAVVGVLMCLWRRPVYVAPAAVAAMLMVGLPIGANSDQTFRSFFGVYKITTSSDGRFRKLEHGTTLHGAMRILNDDGSPALGRPEPTTYYTREGTLGASIASIREARAGQLGVVAVVGLGTGSLACHSAPNEQWTLYELDPEVLRIARDPRYFRFLNECAPDFPVTLGDARITLGAKRDRHDLIILDAFSSDAIPAHLITKEAIGSYVAKLDGRGVLVVHISNRHLDLRHILARVGAEHGLVTYVVSETTDEPLDWRMRAPSLTALLAHDPAHLGGIGSHPLAERMRPDMARRPWTDDFSNIVEAIVDKNWRVPKMREAR